jgi:protein ImuB
MTRRVISIWLPTFATDRIKRRLPPAEARRPLATIREEAGRAIIVAACARAQSEGIRPGLPLADARALRLDILIRPAEPVREAHELAALSDWSGRWTPWSATDGCDGLRLDVTGCAHLFGGETALLETILARFERFGFTVRAGLAATPGAAYALARFATDSLKRYRVAAPGETRAALAILPVAALRIPASDAQALTRLGLPLIGNLLEVARAPLVARFGIEFARRLDQALGVLPEPISPRSPHAPIRVRRDFAEPIGRPEDLSLALRSLLDALGRELEAASLGARRLDLALYRVDGIRLCVEVGLSRPARDPDRLRVLFEERLAACDPGFGVEAMALTASQTGPLPLRQAPLTQAGAIASAADLAALLDRLQNRLGAKAVQQLACRDSHWPERASHAVQPLTARSSESAPWRQRPHRPLRLLARPEPVEAVSLLPDYPPVCFRWRRGLHRVARAEGPERIAGEWWRLSPSPEARDYYRIEDSEGRRFWIYRTLPKEVAPAWYLHGLFA